MKLLREYIRTLLVEETIAIGQCFPHAVKLAREASKEEWNDLTKFKVVHGKTTNKWSGEIVEVGRDVKTFALGDRVIGEICVPCHKPACKVQQPSKTNRRGGS